MIINGGVDGDRSNSRFSQAREAAGPNELLDIDAIAEAYGQIHRQSTSAWTYELDLRPCEEPF